MAVHSANEGRKEFPAFKPGDTLRVHLKVVEGESERIQVFEGVVLRRRGEGISETFTVRKTSFGVGVERVIPLHSPRVQRIEFVKTGRARRARLYYLRELSGKAARLSEVARKPAGGGSRGGAKETAAAPDTAASSEPGPGEKAPQAEAAPASA